MACRQQRAAHTPDTAAASHHFLWECSCSTTEQQPNAQQAFSATFAKVSVPFAKGIPQIPGALPVVAAAGALATKAVHTLGQQDARQEPPPRHAVQQITQQQVQAAATVPLAAAADALRGDDKPDVAYLLTHKPIAVVSLVPQAAVLFTAGAVAGAIGKTITAPLDRLKILLQVGGGRYTGELAKAAASGDLLRSFVAIAKQDGMLGYWKGNLPQVLRVLPYSAMQLYSYEVFKHWFADSEGNLSVPARLTAGACAGMASTLVTYPLDTLRLHMAVDPVRQGMGRATAALYRAGGSASFFKGLGPALLGIAPYMALELAAFDLFPKDKMPSFARGFCAALLATSVCYPLDTVRRQIQMHAAANMGFMGTLKGMVAKDGIGAVYRGFLPNAFKNLPNKGIRLSTFDAAKKLLVASEHEYDAAVEEYRQQKGIKPLATTPVQA